MLYLLKSMSYTDWYILAFILIASEMIISANYALLWCGLAGIIIGTIKLFVPISWQAQWIGFSLLSLIIAISWWFIQSIKDAESDNKSNLNLNKNKMIEKIVTIDKDYEPGINQMIIGETTWTVKSTEKLTKLDQVKVVEMDGVILIVKKI